MLVVAVGTTSLICHPEEYKRKIFPHPSCTNYCFFLKEQHLCYNTKEKYLTLFNRLLFLSWGTTSLICHPEEYQRKMFPPQYLYRAKTSVSFFFTTSLYLSGTRRIRKKIFPYVSFLRRNNSPTLYISLSRIEGREFPLFPSLISFPCSKIFLLI